jgi:hypothetical protein
LGTTGTGGVVICGVAHVLSVKRPRSPTKCLKNSSPKGVM